MSIEILRVLKNDKALLYEFVKAMNSKGFFGQYSIKGNILLHLIQYEVINNKNQEFVRLTNDIDMAMYSFKEEPTKEKVLSLLKDMELENSSIAEVEITKEPNEIRTAWNLKCYKKYGRRKLRKVLSIDIDSKGFKDEFVKIYDVDDQKFYGSTIEKMATDKIRAISTNSLKNRVKDLLDLNILIKIGFNSNKVLSYLMEEKELSDFSYLFNNIRVIKEKLSKLPIERGTNDMFDVDSMVENAINVANIIIRMKNENLSLYDNKLSFYVKSNGLRIIGIKSKDNKLFKTLTGDIIVLRSDSNVEYI